MVQRKGVDAELTLLEMAHRDSARRVWPVSMVRHPVPNVASSNAVQKVLNHYFWEDSGLQWKGTSEDRSTLFDSAKKPGVCPPSGPSSSGQDALPSTAPPPKSMPSASTKTTTSGEAASPGRPASESAATGRDKASSGPEVSAQSSKAASDSGVTQPIKTQEKDTASSRYRLQHQHQRHSRSQLLSQDQCQLLLRNQRQDRRRGRLLLLQEPLVAQRVSRRQPQVRDIQPSPSPWDRGKFYP